MERVDAVQKALKGSLVKVYLENKGPLVRLPESQSKSVFSWKDILKIFVLMLAPAWAALWLLVDYDRKQKEDDYILGF